MIGKYFLSEHLWEIQTMLTTAVRIHRLAEADVR